MSSAMWKMSSRYGAVYVDNKEIARALLEQAGETTPGIEMAAYFRDGKRVGWQFRFPLEAWVEISALAGLPGAGAPASREASAPAAPTAGKRPPASEPQVSHGSAPRKPVSHPTSTPVKTRKRETAVADKGSKAPSGPALPVNRSAPAKSPAADRRKSSAMPGKIASARGTAPTAGKGSAHGKSSLSARSSAPERSLTPGKARAKDSAPAAAEKAPTRARKSAVPTARVSEPSSRTPTTSEKGSAASRKTPAGGSKHQPNAGQAPAAPATSPGTKSPSPAAPGRARPSGTTTAAPQAAAPSSSRKPPQPAVTTPENPASAGRFPSTGAGRQDRTAPPAPPPPSSKRAKKSVA